MSSLFLALLMCLRAQANAQAIPEQSWPKTMTMHFNVYHQSVKLPGGFLFDIERAHRDITRELWFLSEGMQSEKIDFYLFPDRESYLKGSFKPPPWSAGRSESRGYPNPKKIFVTYEGVRRELITHELTHLFFAAYWKRPDGAGPPRWLNEGLAVMMEGRRSPVQHPVPLREFFASSPKDDDPANRVNEWYAEAGSLATFLYKGRASYHMKAFLDSLRDGEPLVDDLQHAYGFRNVEEFERAWKSWAGVGLQKAAKGSDGAR